MRSKCQNAIFSVHDHVAYQIEGYQKCSSMVAKKSPQTPLDPACPKVKIQTFSEHYHVAYQIKWKYKCSNMVANTLPADYPGYGVKIQLFSEYGHVSHRIKRNHEYSIMVAKGSKGQISNFQNMVKVHIKIRESRIQQHGSKYFACRPPPNPILEGGVKRSKFNFDKTLSFCISNQRVLQMQQHGSNYFASRPPNNPWVKMSKFNF